MWIAKPIQALSQAEILAWQTLEKTFPLSQTLCWAKAIEAVSGRAYLIFNPEEQVGGIVFSTGQQGYFECINGPLLNWDDPKHSPRQLATFAMATSQLTPSFSRLILKPRWESQSTAQRLQYLPIPPTQHTQAATVLISIPKDPNQLFQTFSNRLKRTLKTTWQHPIQSQCEPISPTLLRHYVTEMQKFGELRGFTVPPLKWFEALTSLQSPPSAAFWLISSSFQTAEQSSVTQLLISTLGEKAYYLFGYERRTPNLRAMISTAATAHWTALLHCQQLGLRYYDLNGYITDHTPDHPYHGVCQFKKQFSGSIIQYDIPEFSIQ